MLFLNGLVRVLKKSQLVALMNNWENSYKNDRFLLLRKIERSSNISRGFSFDKGMNPPNHAYYQLLGDSINYLPGALLFLPIL